MKKEPVITVKNLSKAYPVYSKPINIIKEMLTGKKYHDDFWALRDISFSIFNKQRIGVIGPNGSGKSTLLKIITGNLEPSQGSIEVNGKISAMLSLNSTLNPEETGLNNIRFNLFLNGCKRSEVDFLTEEIIEFTELGPFIYAPVKTYSSGMNARLAFAITTAIKPEILVVDEVLSVGDAYFVGKATKRMIDLCNQGKALIFVSHATSSIQSLCDTVLWIDNGSIREIGPTDIVIKKYHEETIWHQNNSVRSGNIEKKKQIANSGAMTNIDAANIYRVRLISEQIKQGFRDTHYIRKIECLNDGKNFDADLSNCELNNEENSLSLDIFESEWGRLCSKDDCTCRFLSTKSGKNTGGQIILKKPVEIVGEWRLLFKIEYKSILNCENLILEYVDLNKGLWERAKFIKHETLNDGWKNLIAEIVIPVIEEKRIYEVRQRLLANMRPSVEILEAGIYINGEKSRTIKELEPFEIKIRVKANEKVPVIDVGVKIMRSDGVYVFWQSSGLDDANIYEPEGEYTVTFVFKNNCFSAGDYYISSYCGNGWFGEKNFPHSLIYDHKEGLFTFSVQREYEICSFGVVNIRVPVNIGKRLGDMKQTAI